MKTTIEITNIPKSDKSNYHIDRYNFVNLLGNSPAYMDNRYVNALQNSKITFRSLVRLSRENEVPYSLFFAPKEIIDFNIKSKNERLHIGVSTRTIYMSERGKVNIKDIELIIKDIQRKQDQLRTMNVDKTRNTILKCLNKKNNISICDQAQIIMDKLELNNNDLKECRNKRTAYNYLLSKLEASNIYVSKSRSGSMPQIIKTQSFSGVAIRDNYFPYIFLNTEKLNDRHKVSMEDSDGRLILTMLLLVVCLSTNRCAPVSYSTESNNPISDREYRIAEEILMPESEFQNISIHDYSDIEDLSKIYKTTPSAILMRCKRLKIVEPKIANEIFNEISRRFNEYKNNSKNTVIGHPNTLTSVRDYNGHKFTDQIVELTNGGIISKRQASETLLFSKRKSASLTDLGIYI